jgi:hypothetical protein
MGHGLDGADDALIDWVVIAMAVCYETIYIVPEITVSPSCR